MRKQLVASFLVLGAMASASIADSFSLVRRAAVGDRLRYAITMDFSAMGTEVSITGKATDTVIELKDGVITTERELRDVTLKADNQSQTLSDIVVSQVRMKTTGEVVEVKRTTPRPEDLRAARAIQVEVPFEMVSIGTNWSRTTAAKNGLPEMKADYSAIRQEKVAGVDAVAVRITSKEGSGPRPISADGTFWISPSNGMVVKFDVNIKNFPLDGKEIVDLRYRQEKL